MADEEFDAKRILVVDDEEPMLRTHGRVLESAGFAPVLFSDPFAALEELEERMPAVVIVDLVMPRMSGLELVTRLRTRLGMFCPPVVLVSANLVRLSPMEQILFDALFPKPYGIDSFIQWVRKLARSHADRYDSPSYMRFKGEERAEDPKGG